MALTPGKLIAGVKATLVGLTGIDSTTVHDFRRDVKTEQDAARVWYSETQGRIHAWNVTLSTDMPAKSARGPGFSRTEAGQVMTDFGVIVEGVLGLNDATESEKTFRDLSWVVTLAFNRIGLLSGVGGLATGDVVHQEAMQWEKFGYLALANMYSVHYSRMSVRFTGKVAP